MSSWSGFLSMGAFLAAACSVVAQSAPPATPPAPSQSSPAAPIATLKAGVRLVLVDVVVTDHHGKPVHGLKASEFTLDEGGVPQSVKNFEEHTAITPAEAARLGPMPDLPPGIFTNYNPAPANGAVNLVLLDALNTPMQDQVYVRKQLLEYLKTAAPGTRVAIFGLTTRLILLQGFTSDPALLRRVMEKNLAKGSPLLDDQVGGGGTHNSVADDMEDAQTLGSEQLIANMRQFEAQQQALAIRVRQKYTLDAMNQLARYLSGIPGRKNLIWFSASFPLNILPDTNGELRDPFAEVESSEGEFRDTVSLLSRSQVAVYPVDARGLFNSPVYDAASTRNYTGRQGMTRLTEDQAKFVNDTAAEQSTMLAMAEATGGHAFVNTNGLSAAVATAMEDGSNFYTLSYTPTNSNPDGKLRKIKVQVNRSGVNLAYRKGYYADDPDNLKNPELRPDAAVAATGAPPPNETLRLAMTRGAPTPSEILIKVGVVPMKTGGENEDKPAAGNHLAEKTRGPYLRYSVNYAINPGDLAFLRTGDGKIHADFNMVIFVFTPDGQLVNSLGETAHLAGTVDQIKNRIKQGILFHEEISAPAKGAYFLRIAVHDLHRDHYGAVEVATDDVKNVKPAVLPPTADPAGAAK